MIWAADHEGKATYLGPEWPVFTGQAVEDALGSGWLTMVHPDDAGHVGEAFEQCCANASTFSIQYRLRRANGSYSRVVSGAAPSHSPIDGKFVGYLGAVTEVAEIVRELGDHTLKRRLLLPPPAGATRPLTDLDIACDHVLLARGAAERAGETTVMASLDVTLSLLFIRLGGSRRTH